MPKPGTRWRYGPGYMKLNERGTYSCFVSLGHGKCRRATLKTEAEAKAWILAGTDEKPDRLLIEEAAEARSRLPDDVSILDAVEFYLDHNRDRASRRLSEAWEEYASTVRDALRPKTFSSYSSLMRSLSLKIGDKPLVSVTRERVQEFVDEKSKASKNLAIRSLSPFFNFCVAQGYMERNPCATIRKAKIERDPPKVLPIDRAADLMRLVEKEGPRFVPYYAVALFAGVRPQELLRITCEDFQNGYVRISESVAKTGNARNIPIMPNLAAWLELHPFPKRRYNETEIKRFRRRCGIHIPQDVTRHSYATYLYELKQDAAFVAATMGHAGTTMLFQHYRALAAPGDGQKYFSITP